MLHVSLEYSLPHLGFTNQLMYGGMGLVVDTFLQHWSGPLALCAPLYKPCYDGELLPDSEVKATKQQMTLTRL